MFDENESDDLSLPPNEKTGNTGMAKPNGVVSLGPIQTNNELAEEQKAPLVVLAGTNPNENQNHANYQPADTVMSESVAPQQPGGGLEQQPPSDLPADLEEFSELKAAYKKMKRSVKANPSDASLPLQKKEMKKIIKQTQKLHPEWKAQYKAQHRRQN